MFVFPLYSGFRLIEEGFSKLTVILLKLKARTKRKLGNALRYAIEKVSLNDIRGWFRPCGYPSSLN